MFRELLSRTSNDDRTARQGTDTVYRQLLKLGFTAEDIEQAVAAGKTRENSIIHLSSHVCHGVGDPVIGIAYTGNRTGDEEEGLALMGETLWSGPDQMKIAETIEKDGKKIFLIIPTEQNGHYAKESVDLALKRHANPQNDLGDVYRYTVPELRTMLKGKVTPLPRKRRELEFEYAEKILGKKIVKSKSVASFYYNDTMALVTDEPIILATLEILFGNTVKANSLSYGDSRNRYTRKGFFYDRRDLSVEELTNLSTAEQWYDDRMSDVQEAIVALKASGSLYAISPSHLQSVVSRPDLPEGDYYFINYYPNGADCVYGWFTIEELFEVAAGELTREMIDKKDKTITSSK